MAEETMLRPKHLIPQLDHCVENSEVFRCKKSLSAIHYPTTIDHFVALKGRDACDIILRKIDEQDRFLTDSAPVSLYNIEYTPKLIARRTTGYVRTKKNN